MNFMSSCQGALGLRTGPVLGKGMTDTQLSNWDEEMRTNMFRAQKPTSTDPRGRGMKTSMQMNHIHGDEFIVFLWTSDLLELLFQALFIPMESSCSVGNIPLRRPSWQCQEGPALSCVTSTIQQIKALVQHVSIPVGLWHVLKVKSCT